MIRISVRHKPCSIVQLDLIKAKNLIIEFDFEQFYAEKLKSGLFSGETHLLLC